MKHAFRQFRLLAFAERGQLEAMFLVDSRHQIAIVGCFLEQFVARNRILNFALWRSFERINCQPADSCFHVFLERWINSAIERQIDAKIRIAVKPGSFVQRRSTPPHNKAVKIESDIEVPICEMRTSE